MLVEEASLQSSNDFPSGINIKFQNKRITPQMKLEMMEMFKGPHGAMSNEMIALSVGISVRRVLNLRRKFMQTGNIKVTHKNRHTFSFQRRKALQNQLITNLIRTNRNIKLKEIQHRMKEEGHWMSLASISTVLKKLGFMHRSTAIKVSELRNKDDIEQERYDYSHWIEDKPDDILFYTHSYRFNLQSLNMHTLRRHETMKQMVTLYLTVGVNSIVGYNLVKHEADSNNCIDHIITNFAQMQDETGILMMSVDSGHLDIDFHKMIDENRIRIKLLPFQSLFLNPLCNVFNHIKSMLWQRIGKNYIDSAEELMKNIEAIVKEYPVCQLSLFYREMREAVKLCRNKQKKMIVVS